MSDLMFLHYCGFLHDICHHFIYCLLFAVQLTTCLWDTLSYSNLQWLQQVNLTLTPWAVEFQIVMWSMESLHQAISIQFG